MKIPHVTEVWVNFTTQLDLFIKIWTEDTFFSYVAENYRLNSMQKNTPKHGLYRDRNKTTVFSTDSCKMYKEKLHVCLSLINVKGANKITVKL